MSTAKTEAAAMQSNYHLDSQAECFEFCKNDGSAFFFPSPASGGFGCARGVASIPNDDSPLQPVSCDTYTWFGLTHSAGAIANGLAKRNLRERLSQLRLDSQKRCLRHLKACKVDASDSYECIDTTSELESCGGCINAEYGVSASGNATIGINCAELDGVALGAATCYNSACEAYACKAGYELVSGDCVLIA
ncbi:hypothetical protein I316_05834 [Kwoniella heveanensis BCC8398]|uniref:Protein CPL1-like domain-containing protein n=1 Tax=Kwoniella heveanensis BCC8398 TaxID=1296120 RepID=A0A1B9GMU3_9TREE|nr:hypothetical protein I316_05834 [Kwoniella heveanensis BCC8398]